MRWRARVTVMAATGAAMAVAVTGARAELDRVLPAPEEPLGSPPRLVRAFTEDSWWNTPLPLDAPLHPDNEAILDYLRTGPDAGEGCLKLAGLNESHWGTPMYFARSSDREYHVRKKHYALPPELRSLRIPTRAQPATNSDSTMTVYDVGKGYVVALTGARYDHLSQAWSATGASVTYLDSNGLHVKTSRSDEPRNTGTHRGNNGAVMAVSWDQVRRGSIDHVLKIASGPEISQEYIFPMIGSDGQYDGDDVSVPPAGLRLRLRPTLNLEAMRLDQEALVLAQALQRYGVYIGDSGGITALKVENTLSEGRGRLWEIDRDALCRMPFDPRFWDVIAENYDPRR